MKRFCLISLLLTLAVNSFACGGERTYNYYLFHTWAAPTAYYLYPDDVENPEEQSRIDQFWRDYTGNALCRYLDDHDDIVRLAKQKQDSELLAYIHHLDAYLNAGDVLNRDEWNYPTKEELAAARQSLADMQTAAKAYKGQRLAAQYHLLHMRANMLLERHQDNVGYWEQTAKKLPQSVYRDMMENIYAGALFHTGQRERACDIFARQGDAESIQWALLKFRNLAGIRRIYADNPNSLSLYYLLDEYVNNVQEFADQDGFTDWDADRMEMVHNTAKEQQFRREALDFCAFAQQVVDEGKTKDPALWLTACAMVHYELGMLAEAKTDIAKSEKVKVKNKNANTSVVNRCVALLISMADPQADKQHMVSELQWLTNIYAKYVADRDDYHYRATNRVLIHGLAQRYHKAGNHVMETAVWGLLDQLDRRREPSHEDSDWNPNYNTMYFYQLGQLKTDDLIRYQQQLDTPATDVLDRFVLDGVERNADFFNDLIGTRLIADACYAQAIPYLEKVPAAFYSGLNVSYYLAHRNPHIERWYTRQRSKQDQEGPNHGTFTANPKLTFCREVVQLMDEIELAPNADTRAPLAYRLGTMLYQASPFGECWSLSGYGNSCNGEGEEDNSVFKHARRMLELSREGIAFQQRLKSLYALAYLPVDQWWSESEITSWNGGNPIYRYTPNPHSYRYQALQALDRFAQANPSRIDRHVSKCDVLKQFRRYK